jgi:histidine ammonia-lyase
MILLDGFSLALSDLVSIADRFEPVAIAPAAAARVRAARAVVPAGSARSPTRMPRRPFLSS